MEKDELPAKFDNPISALAFYAKAAAHSVGLCAATLDDDQQQAEWHYHDALRWFAAVTHYWGDALKHAYAAKETEADG